MEGARLLTSDSAAMFLSPGEGTCSSTERISAAGPASWLSRRPLGSRLTVPSIRHMPRLHRVGLQEASLPSLVSLPPSETNKKNIERPHADLLFKAHEELAAPGPSSLEELKQHLQGVSPSLLSAQHRLPRTPLLSDRLRTQNGSLPSHEAGCFPALRPHRTAWGRQPGSPSSEGRSLSWPRERSCKVPRPEKRESLPASQLRLQRALENTRIVLQILEQL